MKPHLKILLSALLAWSVTAAQGAQTITNVFTGTAANDHTGDPLRTAYQKLNTNDVFLDGRLLTAEGRITALGTNFLVYRANLAGKGVMITNAGANSLHVPGWLTVGTNAFPNQLDINGSALFANGQVLVGSDGGFQTPLFYTSPTAGFSTLSGGLHMINGYFTNQNWTPLSLLGTDETDDNGSRAVTIEIGSGLDLTDGVLTATGGGSSTKVYRVLLNRTGTDAPAATILENSLGFTPTWSYVDVGTYNLTHTGGFPHDKTWLSFPNSIGYGVTSAYNMTPPDVIQIIFLDDTGTPYDMVFSDCPFEILVYP